MPLLPYLGETTETKDWTDAQIMSFAICTYLVVALYLAAIGIAVHNFVKFVLRGGKCSLTRPLLVFYILVFLALIVDIVYSFMIVQVYVHWMPFVLYMGPTFKLLSGVEQIWMMIELTLHINVEI